MTTQRDIFIAFLRSSLLGFGGGPAVIPLVHKEVVDNFKWMTDEEFTDVLSIGNTLPGPIGTKMAGYIGYRIGGWLGMINALMATILPTVIALIALLTALKQYSNIDFIKGMTNGVVPIVGVMMAVLTWDFLKKSKKALPWKVGLAILVVSFVSIILFTMNAGIIIAALLILALALPTKKEDAE